MASRKGMIWLHDPGESGHPAGCDLYAVGWRAVGRPRQWVMAVYSSVEAAAEACRGYVRFDGGGRWRVYGTKLVSAGETVKVVRDLVLAAGFEPPAVPVRRGIR